MHSELAEAVSSSVFVGDLKRRLRVTLVISSLQTGGAEGVIASIADHLANCGHDVTLLTQSDPISDWYQVDRRVQRGQLNLGRLQSVRWFDVIRQLQRVLKYRSALLNSQPDVILSFINKTNIFTLLSVFPNNIPVIVSERSSPHIAPLKPLWRILRPLVYPRAHQIVVQTRAAASFFQPRHRDKVVIIPNPVSARGCSADPVGLLSEVRQIIAVGRLAEPKRHDVLIRSFAAACADIPGWRLAIYGEGPLLKDLEALCRELNVLDKVCLAGNSTNPLARMAESHIYAMTSSREGFPNSLCEAMAVGLPVVATDCRSGPSEIITPNVDGLLVPENDVYAISQALRRLMLDAELRSRLGSEARTISDRLSHETILSQWEQLLHHAANHGADDVVTVPSVGASEVSNNNLESPRAAILQ